MEVADLMQSAVACDKLATATAQLTRTHASWFSTLYKIFVLLWELKRNGMSSINDTRRSVEVSTTVTQQILA